jgi:glycogen synthase
MKILWLTENYFPRKGGMAQSCDRIVEGLRSAGIYIFVVHLTTNGKKSREAVNNGANLHFPLQQQVTGQPIDETHALQLLWLELQNEKNISHLLTFGGTISMTAAPVLAAWLAVPLVVLLRGNDFDTGVFSARKRDTLDFALSRAAAVACVTHEKAQKVQQLYPKTQVFFTPNGIDITSWFLLKSDKEKAKQIRNHCLVAANLELQIENTEKRIIGIFGQLKAKKGVLFFMQAIEEINIGNEIHLLIVGELEEEVQNWLINKELSFSYSHFPFMERYNLLPYYAACDVVAIPSFYDGMPNVLLEAGALGLPFIASDAGGMPDVIRNEENSWLFKAGDIESCKEVLQNFIQISNEKLHEFGANLQAHITNTFTLAKETNKYIEIFEKVV